MKIIRTKTELQSSINHNDKIGFVPTTYNHSDLIVIVAELHEPAL